MLRFGTNRKTYTRMEDDIAKLNTTLNAGLTRQEHAMRAFVSEAIDRWSHDPFKTMRTYVRSVHSEDANAPSVALQSLLAIRGGDQQIDVASYDRVRVSQTEYQEGWRIFDLAGRGNAWLDAFVKNADELCDDVSRRGRNRNTRIGTYAMQGLEPDEFVRMAKATLEVMKLRRSDEAASYLYYRVHTYDTRGLFATVLRHAQYAMGPRNCAGNRPIVRGCCRGMGGHGIVLVAIPGEENETGALTKDLCNAITRHESVCDIATGRGKDDYPRFQREYEVVHESSPPTVVGLAADEVCCTAYFVVADDKPGVLLSICDAASSVPDAMASVYYVDARRRPDYGGNRIACFPCAVGWVVKKTHARAFAAAINKRLSSQHERRKLCEGEAKVAVWGR